MKEMMAEVEKRESIRIDGLLERNILIVGSGKRAVAFARKLLDRRRWGIRRVRIVGVLDPNPRRFGPYRVEGRTVGSLDDLPSVIKTQPIDEVLFIVPRSMLGQIEKAVAFCEMIGLKTRVAMDIFTQGIAKPKVEEVAGWPFITFSPPPHSTYALGIKRFSDILLSSMALILLSPLFLIIAATVKLTSPGPVFFNQQRYSMNGRRFTMLKFRTMVENAEAMKPALLAFNEVPGPVFKMKKDPRVTLPGKWLRKYSLDELPQFFNVLRGDMSIVGPRPPLPAEVVMYDPLHRRRLSVKPGMTCLWQINGRHKVNFEEWMRLDLEYIDRWSLGLDFKILLKTIPAVLRGTGV